MTLPKIDKPLFDILIPSLNEQFKFRPFVVREEKILLIAQQSGSDKDVITAIKQVINNCIQDNSIDVDTLALFDLEYIFLKLRSRSVNNIVKLSFRDREDDKVYDFDVDLEEVEMLVPAKTDNKIKISDTVGMIMRYPSVAVIDNIPNDATANQVLDTLIINCIKEIYDQDTVYPVENYTQAQIEEFIDNMDVNVFDKIREFFDGAPRVYYKIDYTNSAGTERTIELTSINDFFTWR